MEVSDSEDRSAQQEGLQLRPMSMGDVIDAVIIIVLRRPILFVGLVLVEMTPGMTLAWWHPEIILHKPSFVPGEDAAFNLHLLSLLPQIFLVLLVYVVVSTFTQGLMTLAVASETLGQPFALRKSAFYVIQRWPRLLWLGMATGGLLMVAMCLLVLPFFYAAAVFALAPSVCVLEDRPAFQALARSWRLASRQWWRILGYMALAACANFAIGLPAQALWAMDMLPESTTLILLHSAQLLFNIVFYIGLVLLYFDRRVRNEGLDLVLLSRQLGETRAAA